MRENPFSKLEGQIREKIFRQREQPDELLITCDVQLKLLKVLYRSMLEYDMREHMQMKSTTDYEEHSYKATKSVLDYFQFINVLNQFGRILEKQGFTIPKFNRIKFFRNKVSEHWEEYTKYGITGSFHQSFGEAAIPSTSTSYKPEERTNIKKEIDNILEKFGLTLDIENPEVGNIADLNGEIIYSTLEKIDSTLIRKKINKYIIPDRLVELLFQFGFPAPIDKVTEYSNEFVIFLENVLKDRFKRK